MTWAIKTTFPSVTTKVGGTELRAVRPLVRLLKLILANLKKGNWFEYFGAKNQFGFL
jgi:hypothetical protein